MRTPEQNRRARVAYHAAYSVLPREAQSDCAGLLSGFEESPETRAIHYFTVAARELGEKADAEDVRRLKAHTGRFGGGPGYVVVEYPRFPAVDLLKDFGGALPVGAHAHVVAPYFSAVIDDRDAGEAWCFVLGQSPDANTTLRLVSPLSNANLGPGCEPVLAAFLELLRERLRSLR